MADNGSTDDWSDILSERVGQEKAKTPEAETQTPGDSAGGAPPPGPASEEAVIEPGSRPRPPDDTAPRPASGPRGHYTATVHGGRPQPLDSLGPGYGGITTGWKVPTTGGLALRSLRRGMWKIARTSGFRSRMKIWINRIRNLWASETRDAEN